MAEFIPTYNLSDFKKLKADQIRRLKSCELVADGVYVATITVPQTDYIRLHTEQLALLGNAVGGETLENILEKEITPA